MLASVSILALGSGAWADAPQEDDTNMVQIGAVAYFQSLGWNFNDADWTGTITWDPLGTGSPVTLTTEQRNQALGAGATVAIFDGRANDTHTDLPYNPDPNADPATDSVVFEFTGFPFSPSYTAPDLHGTHVSGIVGARLNGQGMAGVAPMARLLNYAVFDDNGWVGADEDVILGDAVSWGASVVNMSYGPTVAGDFSSSTTLKAIENHKSSIVVVKSAGNDGVDLMDETLKGKTSNPLSNLIIVGSTNQSGSIAWYSNTPGDACIRDRSGCKVMMRDIFMVAPGGNVNVIEIDGQLYAEGDADGYTDGIWSTDELGWYYRISGTSMAAPHVAGAVALLHSNWPILKTDPQATRDILFSTAFDLGAPGIDNVYGHGMLNVQGAMSPIGALEFGLTGGGDGGGGKKGGGNGGGNGGGKPRALTWTMGESSMQVRRGFAALSEATATVSVFDDYRRDFQVPLSAMVQNRRSDFSRRLEAMVAPEQSDFDRYHHVEGRNQLRNALTLDYRSQQPSGPQDMMASLPLVQSRTLSVSAFTGYGNATSLFYSPAARVGGAGSAASDTNSINPFLSFASGEQFSGLSLEAGTRLRVTAGYTQAKSRQMLFEDYDAGAAIISGTYRLSDHHGFNVSLTSLRETGGAFGSLSKGAFALGDAETEAVTMSWDAKSIFGLDLTLSYTLGQSSGEGLGIISVENGTRSEAFHAGLSKADLLLERDELTLSVSQPLRVMSGDALIHADKAYDEHGNMLMQTEQISLVPSGRELDVQIGYGIKVRSNAEVSTFGYYAKDAGHIQGEEESGFGVKYQLRF